MDEPEADVGDGKESCDRVSDRVIEPLHTVHLFTGL